MRTMLLNKTSWMTQPDVTNVVLQDVWGRVSDLVGQYPDFHNWFARKVVPGIFAGERTILVEYRGGDIAGLVILKDTDEEQKLCCLRVMENFFSTGLGIRLFEKSFELLNNDKPLLSISDTRLSSFSRVCEYFGFSLEQKLDDIYQSGHSEYVFNGTLSENKHTPPSLITQRSLLNPPPPALYFA